MIPYPLCTHCVPTVACDEHIPLSCYSQKAGTSFARTFRSLLSSNVIVKALMAGKNPEEAMAAAIEHIPNHAQLLKAPDVSEAPCDPQHMQQNPRLSLCGQSASPTSPYSAGRLGIDGATAKWEQECTTERAQSHAPGRSRAVKSRVGSMCDEQSDLHSPPLRGRSQTQRSPTEFEARTMQDWKDNANNPKADTYRYGHFPADSSGGKRRWMCTKEPISHWHARDRPAMYCVHRLLLIALWCHIPSHLAVALRMLWLRPAVTPFVARAAAQCLHHQGFSSAVLQPPAVTCPQHLTCSAWQVLGAWQPWTSRDAGAGSEAASRAARQGVRHPCCREGQGYPQAQGQARQRTCPKHPRPGDGVCKDCSRAQAWDKAAPARPQTSRQRKHCSAWQGAPDPIRRAHGLQHATPRWAGFCQHHGRSTHGCS